MRLTLAFTAILGLFAVLFSGPSKVVQAEAGRHQSTGMSTAQHLISCHFHGYGNTIEHRDSRQWIRDIQLCVGSEFLREHSFTLAVFKLRSLTRGQVHFSQATSPIKPLISAVFQISRTIYPRPEQESMAYEYFSWPADRTSKHMHTQYILTS